MEGYGPSGAALVRIGEAGSKLIVTVDCGAQAFDAISDARAAGVEVIVVDHHKRSEESRVGKECVSTFRSGWSTYPSKKKNYKYAMKFCYSTSTCVINNVDT